MMQELATYLNKLLNYLNQGQLDDIDWHSIVRGIPDIISCDCVGIRFYNPRTNTLRLMATVGFPEDYDKNMKEVAMPEIGWTIVRDGRPLIPKDYRLHPAYRAWRSEFEKLHIKKNIVAGLYIDQKFLGYISLCRKQEHAFKRSEVKRLRIIANIIAKELSRFYHLNIEFSLYHFFLRVKKRVGFKEFFEEVLETVADCFNVNGAAVFLLEGKVLKPISTYGKVISMKQRSIIELPELIENIDIRNAFIIPSERSEILCKAGHQIAVAPIPLPHDQQGFFILCFQRRYLLTNDDLALLYIWATAISEYLVNVHAIYQLRRDKDEMTSLGRSLISALVGAFEIRSPHFKNHSRNVAKYSVNFARILGWKEDKVDRLQTAALLHDIGKVGVPDKILNKPSELSDREWKIIKRHPQISCDIIIGMKKLKQIIPLIKYHHERWNGKGYPSKLKGKKIPVGSRIMSIVDAYQALISDRPYRQAHTKRKAMKIIREESGIKFDPELVKIFLENIKKITQLIRK